MSRTCFSARRIGIQGYRRLTNERLTGAQRRCISRVASTRRKVGAQPMTIGEWETVIGLEIHAQLSTQSKIFSGSAIAYGAPPNAQANLVDLGYPGVLPVLNGAAVRMAVKFGLAIGAKIAPHSVFARKNYFYPDLPKGYQISQFEDPVVQGGSLTFAFEKEGEFVTKTVNLTRAHLEEDAGKSLHED